MMIFKNRLLLLLPLLLFITSSCKKKDDNLLITYKENIAFKSEKDLSGIDTSYLEVAGPLSKFWMSNSSNFIIHNSENNRKDLFFTSRIDHERCTYEIIDTNNYIIKDLPDEKTILGFNCKKAIITSSSDSLTVFYTDEINSNYIPIGKIKGCVLEYTYKSKLYTKHSIGVDVAFNSAKKVVVPSNYKETTISEYLDEVNRFRGYENKLPFVSEGQVAPNFSIPDINGNTVDMDSKMGKVLVFNFWFIACAPCVKEMPELNKIVSHFKDNDKVEFYAFATDEKNQLIRFLRRKQFDFTIVPLAGKIAHKYGVNAYPTTIIINPDGKIAKTYEFTMIDQTMMEEVIQEIKEAASPVSN